MVRPRHVLIACGLLALAAGGCARRSELEAAKADLADAQNRIKQLEAQRVPRLEYDVTKASLKLADEQIAGLERELKAAREQLAMQSLGLPAASGAADAGAAEIPTSLGVLRGSHELSNGTFVFSPDAQLVFGKRLLISSPTGLLVTDPDQRVVGGDLSIQAKDMTLETSDGLLTAEADGSVKFTGNSLKMKFAQPATSTNQTPQGSGPSRSDEGAASSAAENAEAGTPL